MHSILHELHHPTAIDHAIRCHFFNYQEVNLITAGGSLLTVYRLHDVEPMEEKNESQPGSNDGKVKKIMEQVASFQLFGNIINMQRVQLGNNCRDSILLAFKDAKLSIVEYDPVNHDLKTDSMHFFENNELKHGLTHNIYFPLVRVDPENRCASMLVYGRHVVVLPFRQQVVKEEHDDGEEREHIKSVLPSYMIDLQALDQPILNVLDLQFLHGYQEPTLMLLYEPVQTVSGRVAVRQDTYCVAAISLNMTEKVHPIIWTVNNLPFDCQMLRAVEKPLGGVLVFASNSLIYLNQSAPPYGVSLNSMTELSTMFPLKNQPDTVITLAEASCAFLSPTKLVLSLKGGEIYVLNLLTDGLRNIQSFHFDKAAGSVLASCVCHVTDGFVFIGSRLGNSLLLRYSEKTEKLETKPEPGEPPLNKKRKTNPDYNEEDQLLFGDGHCLSAGQVTMSYAFDISDSLLNIGPITKCAVGEPAFLSEEFSSGPRNDLELVCCSGYGKNGALTVLQKSMRPQVVTTFELPGCVDMWTVYSQAPDDEEEKSLFHRFLILSREDSTMVLKTGDEITELDNSGFNVKQPTIYAGNLGLKKCIMQVNPGSIRLLEGSTRVDELSIESGVTVTGCSSTDPHSLLLMSDGSIRYVQLLEDFMRLRLKVSQPKIEMTSKIVSVCVYKDESGLFNLSPVGCSRASATRLRRLTSVAPSFNTDVNMKERKKSLTIEDEEEMLYGNSNFNMAAQESQLSNIRRPSFSFQPSNSSKAKNSSHWCILCRENGGLEVYSLPDFKLVFCCQNFGNAPKVLVDHEKTQQAGLSSGEMSGRAREILMFSTSHKRNRPLLFAIMEQDLIIYECYPFSNRNVNGHLSIRFKRLESNFLMRLKEESKLAELVNQKTVPSWRKSQLKYVEKVSSYEDGIFVCGVYPHWVFITSHGHINGHPMTVDGPITAFATFNNVNCPNGFLYFNKQGELRICVLPTHLNYDAPWPVRKIPLRMTPYDIAYEPEAKVYAVACAYTENQKKIPRFHSEEREFDSIERESRYIYPQVDRFVVQLISPTNWEVIPNSRTVLHEFEHVTCMKVVSLQSEFLGTGLKQCIVVGTSYNFGEDLACKGRILIFDIIEVVPEPGQPLTKTKCKCLYDKEQKGPITAITASSGYLIVAQGQKIYAYSFKTNDLVGVAFVDAQVYTVSLIALRNIIVAADISRSISLIRFQVNHKSLALVSRDSKHLESYCVEFFIDGPRIGFLVSDVEHNLMTFTYQPETLESFGGQRLLQVSDINVGSPITTMFRVKVAQEEVMYNKLQDQRQVVFMPTLDGSIFTVVPLQEKTYRRLLMLQNKLVDCMQHKAGLNPRSFRALNVPLRELTNSHKNILDGQLLLKYVQMSFQERYDIARKMGTTAGQILDDLMDVQRACAQF